jgi:ATP-dependent helicase/nuclease subunit A
VGDPKQSIYRFRRADIDTYNIVKDQIQKSKGKVLYLTSNFRSLPSLADWNNPIFQTIFPIKKETRYQARFSPLNTVRTKDKNLWHGVSKITIPKMERNRKEDIALYDAQKIASFIDYACERNLMTYSDFLILVRFKENMDLYARALEKRGIPFEITGSETLSKSEAVNDILTLARALREPDNPIYTVSCLRSLFFGISDAELFHFKMQGGWFHFLSPLNQKNTPNNASLQKIQDSLCKMKEWWTWKKTYPATVVLEKILDQTGLINYLASSEMGSSKAGNVFKMIEILKNQELRGYHSFSDLVEFMEEITSLRDLEEISLTPGKKNAVRLMNLHKVKGLEAPVVFLANPKGKKTYEPDKHIVRKGDTPQGYFLLDKKSGFHREVISHPLNWHEKVETEKQYEEAEEARLMYVASTRARNLMVISTYEENLKHKSWNFLDHYLNEIAELTFDTEAQEKEEKQKEKLSLQKNEWENAQKQIHTRKKRVEDSTYRIETVTNIAKSKAQIPHWTQRGKGESWGRAVHALLKLIGEGKVKDMELQAENILTAEERDLSEKSELLDLINSITQSQLWNRMLKAKEKFYEIPFSVKTDPSSPKPVILNGVIDLVFLEPDGWVIADYKTDEINGGLQSFIDYYTPQVKVYVEFWEKITGKKVKEAGIYFTSINKWVRV